VSPARAETPSRSLRGGQQFGVLATLKRSGQPHLASMVYAWDPHERMETGAWSSGSGCHTCTERPWTVP
jgi:hypothetical protein